MAEMKKQTVAWGNWYEICCRYLFPAILFLYPLRHIHLGLDLWDTGYNYSNFQYMGMEHMDPMWLFSTYLANAVGFLLSKLPFAGSLLGMNFYTGLMVSGLALLGYYFCSKVLEIPRPIVFLGELVAISLCWCPTALLYNYLTYILFFAGTALLYLGLAREQKKYLILAGVALGTNVFVRFSNLPEAALILAVWAYGWICRSKVKKVLAQTGWCIGGYAAVVGVWLGWISLRYGFGEYVSGILRLFGMTETATDYKPTSMLTGMLLPYLQNLYWVKWLVVLVIAGVFGFMVLPGRFTRMKKIGFAGLTLSAVGWLYYRGFCSLIFSDYNAMLRPGILFLMLCLVVCGLLILGRKTAKETKLAAGLVVLVILLTSLGSNNGVFPSLNNLFIAAPFTLWQIYLFCRSKAEYGLPGLKKVKLIFYPAKAMAVSFLLVFLFQSIGFGTGFVFVEAAGAKNIDTKVENNDILEGIWMSADRAEWMTQISAYVSEQGLKGKEMIPYGELPALTYYLQMPPAFNSWSDLRSYGVEAMEEDLEELRSEIAEGKEKPVVIVENTYMVWENSGRAGLVEMGLPEHKVTQVETDVKWELLKSFMEEYSYRQTFGNEKFTVFE
ncbi:MAG: hypothetical protein E7293_00345 [Lachnospiraceae bacterium]|nr:hypothetical protein [Lachnospiraceae bacterium]